MSRSPLVTAARDIRPVSIPRLVSIVAIAVLLAAAGAALGTGALNPPRADELAGHVGVLAAPDMEGRGSGTPGGERAARYLADRLAADGLVPGGDGGTFFQWLPVGSGMALTPDTALEPLGRVQVAEPRADASGRAALAVGRDFMPHGGSVAGEVDAELVFVGHGTARGSVDEWSGAEVRGKIALALEGGAGSDGPLTRLDKLIAARRHGAAALLIAGDALPSLDATAAPVKLLSASITRAAADTMLAPAGQNLAALASSPAGAVATGVRARLRISLDRHERRAANVVGLLPGADPALAREAVVLGAHYDHLGRSGGVVHPGADDNASGTAVVLGLARAFARAGGAPRTLVFALFAGEEIGLLGSAHYAQHPTVPVDRTIAMLNFDMVGRLRDRKLYVGGVESGVGLRALVSAAANAEKLELDLGESPFAPSDHASFYTAGVPVLFFHTGGHDDYHRPGDTADKINAAGMAEVATVGARIAERLAADAPPALVKLSPPKGGRRSHGATGGAFLGVAVDGRWESDGLKLGSVVADSGAARAGLRGGDVLVRVDGAALGSFEDLQRSIRDKRAGDTITVLYLRDGEERTASATLGERP